MLDTTAFAPSWWDKVRAWLHGAEPFPRPSPFTLQEVKTLVHQSLVRHPRLPEEHRQEYQRSADAILERMTEHGLRRLRAHVNAFRFFNDVDEMMVELYGEYAAVRQAMAMGQTITDGYDPESRCLLLDGGEEDNPHRSTLARYAHEFVHAMDGPERELSNAVQWREAWEREIADRRKRRPLSLYARKSPREGLCEFGRLMYSEIIPRAVLAVTHPLCTTYWKGRGIW
jgi:hypothetical protein